MPRSNLVVLIACSAACADATTFTFTPCSSRTLWVTLSGPGSADTTSAKNGSMKTPQLVFHRLVWGELEPLPCRRGTLEVRNCARESGNQSHQKQGNSAGVPTLSPRIAIVKFLPIFPK